jgi:hypothetical protein
MPRRINKRRLFLGITAPQQEHDWLRLRGDKANDSIGKPLPPFVFMRCGKPAFDGQYAVEQQHALLCPMFKEAVAWPGDAKIAFKLLKNIEEAWRRTDAGTHAETQAVCLTGAVIGVLPKDDDAHLVQRRQIESAKPFAAFGKNRFALGFFADEKAFENGHVGAGKLLSEGAAPTSVQFYTVRHSAVLQCFETMFKSASLQFFRILP